VIPARPDGLLLPKARSGEDVHKLSIALHHEEERAGVAGGSTRIVAIATETPISLLQLQTYVGASTRLEALTWGAEDLSAEIGARSNREDDGRTWTSPYRLARDLTLFAAAAAKVQALDTVFVSFRDAEGLLQECREAVRDGFTGKMAIHPGQVAIMNEAFTPTPEEVASSEEIVAAFAAAPQAGVISIRGHMVDRPHLTRAERILARAKAARQR
jgi:citrate lyase subunit beta/citryl-CoA lyase